MKKHILSIALTLSVVLVSCSNNTTPPTADNNTGQQSSSLPAEVRQLLNQYALPDDGSMPEGQSYRIDSTPPPLSDTSYDVFAVTLVWGRLPIGFSQPPQPVNWSGNVSVNGVSVLQLLTTISFEHAQDSIVPASMESSIAWVSITDHDFDGITFLIYLKRGIVYFTAPVLRFETGPMNLEWDFGQLASLYGYYPADSSNGVAIFSRQLHPHICSQGLLTGEWIRNDVGGSAGTLAGMWVGTDGSPVGYFTGVFWIDSNNVRLFSGQLSGYHTPQVIARFGGTWFYDDPRDCPMCGAGHGKFAGKYYYLDGSSSGRIGGEFGWADDPANNHLPLHGTWKQFCPWVNFDLATPAN